ncbi:MAG: hypothetical protein ACE5IR_10110 [bacterium]
MKAKLPRVISYHAGLISICMFVWVSCRGDGAGLTESGDLPTVGPLSFAGQIQPIFDANCIRCHKAGGIGFNATGGAQNNGLDLTTGNSHGRLVNQPTFEAPSVEPKLRVNPGAPDGSYLVQKITSSSPKFGNRMPLDGPPFLSQGDIQLIRDWIEQGAPNN